MNWRRGAMFGAGLLLGVLGAAALFSGNRGDAPAERPVAAATTSTAAMGAAAAPAVKCSFGQIVPAASREDGLLPLDKDLQGRSSSAVTTLLVTGKEAAASGKQRDAETAFLMACRSAETLKNDAIPLADAHYNLGRHYATLAADPSAPNRKELLSRAEDLYASALQAYTTNRGPEHERTRFAREGLDNVRQLAGGDLPQPPVAPVVAAAPAQPAAPATPAPAAAPAPAPAPHVAAAPPARAPAPAPQVAAAPAARPAAPAPAAKPARPQAPANDTRVAGNAPATSPAPAPVEAPRPAAKPQPQPQAPAQPAEAKPREAQVAAVTPPRERPRSRVQPSFDCNKARSTTEKLICADEDLARQDRELGRLHSRAKQAAADPRAFQRQSDAEWAHRESTCTDADCLQRWYAQRRAELGAAASRPAPAARAERPVARDERPAERAGRSEPAPIRIEPEPPRVVRVEPAPRVVRSSPPMDSDGSGAPPTAAGSIGTASGDVGSAN